MDKWMEWNGMEWNGMDGMEWNGMNGLESAAAPARSSAMAPDGQEGIWKEGNGRKLGQMVQQWTDIMDLPADQNNGAARVAHVTITD